MKTKLFGITEKELNSELSNIFIGISLGNKDLDKQLAKNYLLYALKYTKEKVAVLIADEIDAINWEIFRGFSPEEAKEKVKNKGKGLAEMFNNTTRQISIETKQDLSEKVKIITWIEIKTKNFLRAEKIIAEEYKNNFEFKERVLCFVEEYTKLRRKILNQKEKGKLATYIISELPTLIEGIEYNDESYQIVLYPTYVNSGMSEFVLDIQNGVYPELLKKLKIKKSGKMIESYLNNFEK